MIIREYTDADYIRITELHKQSGFDYQLPPLSREAFFSLRIAEGDGTVGMAAFMRHTAEAYLLCDPTWRTPAWRLEALRQLCNFCNNDAKIAGVREVEAFLPPEIVKKFGKRLVKLGWSRARDGWVSYSKGVV